MTRILILLVKFYQFWISPLQRPTCRFSPSCSFYMIDALNKHGLLKGMMLGIKRLLRCNPWNAGGYDPVP